MRQAVNPDWVLWIFFIKVPVALIGGGVCWMLLRSQPDPTEKAKINGVGLGLLVVWVGALQIMLDEGRNQDWFVSPEIQVLAVVAAIGFLAFLIWELTDKNPIVDLKIFRHRGFAAAACTYAAGFGAFFASIVILPLWLQQNMGYTATWAGYATGVMGILAVGKLVQRGDRRAGPDHGVADDVHIGRHLPADGPVDAVVRTVHGDVLRPLTGLAIASFNPNETANAAGLSNFMRTLAGAFATSLVQTGWSNAERRNQTELAGAVTHANGAADTLVGAGASHEAAVTGLTSVVEGQSLMLATIDMFGAIAVVFLFAATLIWLAPKPKGPIDTSAAH